LIEEINPLSLQVSKFLHSRPTRAAERECTWTTDATVSKDIHSGSAAMRSGDATMHVRSGVSSADALDVTQVSSQQCQTEHALNTQPRTESSSQPCQTEHALNTQPRTESSSQPCQTKHAAPHGEQQSAIQIKACTQHHATVALDT